MIEYDIVNNKRIINLFRRKGVSKVNFEDNFAKISEKVKERILKEVPDTGYFRSFAEDFSVKNKNIFGRSVSICVERDETADGKALLLVSLLHPVLNKDASKMLACGDRETLLKYMSGENFSKEFENAVLELSESLKKQG